ncbi:MAG: alpha/beta fold hydrolase [Phycisphaerales bacterium]|nr:alpha/beta fold hydrolase [Phycisphaerales bacterium]
MTTLQIILLAVGIGVVLFALGVGILYWFRAELLFRFVIRLSGGMVGLRWRNRGGWPLFEGGTPEKAGDPPLVLIHGFGVDKQTMFNLARILVRTHKVLAPDLPGFGEHSIVDPENVNIDTYIDAIDGLLDQEGIDRVILVGSSMGGGISATYAARHSRRVAGLCLIGPAGLEPPYNTEIYEMGKRDENPLRVDSIESFNRIVDLNFSNPPWLPHRLRVALMRRASLVADSHETILRGMSETLLDGVRPLLGHIRCPVSVVWGGEDRIIHPSVAPHWEHGLPDVEMNLIPGAGHSTMMERPAEIAEIIERLMQRIRRKVSRS